MDPDIQTGKRVVTVGTKTTPFDVAVTFATPFSTPPVVIVSQASGGDAFYHVGSKNITTTGFTLIVNKTGPSGSTKIRAEWAAFPSTNG